MHLVCLSNLCYTLNPVTGYNCHTRTIRTHSACLFYSTHKPNISLLPTYAPPHKHTLLLTTEALQFQQSCCKDHTRHLAQIT